MTAAKLENIARGMRNINRMATLAVFALYLNGTTGTFFTKQIKKR
jgi:hypothetical protein